ncbi:T9SS type A sorting domain-containing protein [Gracilimonas mengyeensis]|uniref:Por secretion system C-terminal sorting domain-containing protein n=1 Tax=Gracilimonas mengyeensis TaxID=1302730 RepID=A0A521F6M4_9BACT|nr:T9SS type A sorting domain-containing protein [Gracilimonas mengyeensis]SMO91150.1 Por secretion system C-terminal sorting domain-containing protein [Gracilimonas mengyeensis]
MVLLHTFFRVIMIGILATFLLEDNPVQAQTWQSLNGPLESNISKIIVQGDSIFVVSHELDGFFKKHKDADQWLFVHFSVSYGSSAPEMFNSLEVKSDGTYFAGLPGGAVPVKTNEIDYFYTSDDFGESWKPMGDGLGYCSGGIYPGVNAIIISRKGSLIVDCGYSIYKYSDEEQIFKETSENLTISSNPVFSFYEFEDTLAAGRATGIEYSTDDGDSWTTSSFDSVEVFDFEFMSGKWFAGTNAGLYSSNSITGAFKKVNELPELEVYALYRYKDHLFVGTGSGAFRINPMDASVRAIFNDSHDGAIKALNSVEDMLLLGTEEGLYECSTGEENCTLTGVPNAGIRTINFQGEDTLWVGTRTGVHRYFKQTGQWDSSFVPIRGTTLRGNIIPLSDNRFYSFGRNYFYSCSMVNSRCDSTQVDPGNTIFDVKKNTEGDLFLATRRRVFKSINKGENWELIYSSPEGQNFSLNTFSDSLLFINSDAIKYNLIDNSYESIDKTVSLVTQDGILYSSSNGIHKSTDFGETWTTIFRSSDISNQDLGGIKFLLNNEDENKLYAITTEGAVFVSENQGEWGVNKEMYPVYTESVAIGPGGTLYLGTSTAGVFSNTKPLNPPITISNEEKAKGSIPRQFNLKQNYPNPFNPTTMVPYELSQAVEVRISLYNIFGQKVREYNLGLQQPGAYQHPVEMNQQASGVYLLKMQAGEHSDVVKISFIK